MLPRIISSSIQVYATLCESGAISLVSEFKLQVEKRLYLCYLVLHLRIKLHRLALNEEFGIEFKAQSRVHSKITCACSQ